MSTPAGAAGDILARMAQKLAAPRETKPPMRRISKEFTRRAAP